MVMPVERSESWAKMDHETQKEGAKVLSFGETKSNP
jgi:hypothetical protein